MPSSPGNHDARARPDSFGASDLSGALRCYRVLRPDYRLGLSVVRHAAAAVLPTQVEQVQAATAATAIRIAMPEHGREIRLRRTLLNAGGGTLRVVFEARRAPAGMRLLAYWPLLPAGLGLWLLLRLAFGPGRRRNG